nr:NAD(P)-binding oxidoreductase [uncultured Mucilaginibacter sp.]
MRVLLLGATGRTGKHVLTHLLKAGHVVNAVVRDKTKLNNNGQLHVFESDDINKTILKHAMQGCEAIISMLNISRTSDFPWAKLRTPKTFLSDAMANIIAVAEEAGIKKVVVCSAWGVHETKKDIPTWFRWLIDYSNIGVAYLDHERQELLLRQSKLDFTIVRPVGLTNSTKEKQVQVSQNNSPKPKMMVSRKNTGAFFVQLLSNTSYSRHAIVISEK